MHQSLTLVVWRGIRIGVHWSMLVIFALLTVSLATTVLPYELGTDPSVGSWIAGLVAAAAFLTSIGLHELGHARQAARAGVEVRSITLWLFGGIAQLGRHPPTWRDELRIALAGPLTSLAIGLGAGAMSLALDIVGWWPLVSASLWWLGTTNLIVALFNLLPGAPLDGGRVVTALRWRQHGDPERARAEAARAGIVLGQVVVFTGVGLALLGAGGAGIWIALLGWFVIVAARAELGSETARTSLHDLRVADAMTAHPFVVPATLTLDRLVDDVVPAARGSSFPVVDGARVVGLVTYAQVRQVPPARWPVTAVDAVALPASALVFARPDEALVDALERMQDERQRIVVLDAGEVVGIVSPSDISRVIQQELLRRRVAT